MGEVVYILCAVTCLICTALLVKQFSRSRAELLLWSAIAFLFFSLTNVLLFVDLVMLPNSVDLTVLRNGITLIGAVVLLYGLVRETTA